MTTIKPTTELKKSRMDLIKQINKLPEYRQTFDLGQIEWRLNLGKSSPGNLDFLSIRMFENFLHFEWSYFGLEEDDKEHLEDLSRHLMKLINGSEFNEIIMSASKSEMSFFFTVDIPKGGTSELIHGLESLGKRINEKPSIEEHTESDFMKELKSL